jgi:sterol desaturase/sphingolipid hydroxylase (fatty acid hydroxylase superfamily)
MLEWLSTWAGMLGHDSTRLWMAAALLVFMAFVETRAAAELRQGWIGRLRNLGFGALYVLVGAGAWAAVHTAYPLSFRIHEDGSMARSLLIVAGYVAVTDFVFYWYHRAQHRFKFLWALHELHHADTELNATTSFRTFWLEYPVQAVVLSVPTLLLLGIDRTAAVIFPLVQTGILMFTHWNVRLRLGPLTPVFCGPQLHRIHHSILPHHRDTNFSQVFPIFDVLFGTYRAPQRDEFPPTGTEDLASDASLARVLVERPLQLWTGRASNASKAR